MPIADTGVKHDLEERVAEPGLPGRMDTGCRCFKGKWFVDKKYY